MHRKAKKPARAAKSQAGRRMRAATPTTKKRGPAGKSKARFLSVSAPLEPGAPSDLDLMQAIQAEDPDALAQLYDRYNGILKALILRVVHNDAEERSLAGNLHGDLEPGEEFFCPKRQTSRLDGYPGAAAGD